VSGWPVAGPTGFWLLASRPASKSNSPLSNITNTIQHKHRYIIQTIHPKQNTYTENTDSVETFFQRMSVPVPVAARSKAWVSGSTRAETVGSNSTGGME
jgi:hypothetical protein